MNVILSVLSVTVGLIKPQPKTESNPDGDSILVQAIKSVEAIFPQSGQGPAKLEMIKAMIKGAMVDAENVIASFDKVWPIVQGIVGAIVGVFNSVGIFTKK